MGTTRQIYGWAARLLIALLIGGLIGPGRPVPGAAAPTLIAWSWGNNGGGQLGDGTSINRATPAPVSALGAVAMVATGEYHSLALKADGTVWAWGDNAWGQLGIGPSASSQTPVQVVGLAGVQQVSADGYHSLALKGDGTVWAWGQNLDGQLGDGSTTNRNKPVQVAGLANVTAVAAGYSHSLALKADGTVRAWGANLFGQLGDGTTTKRTSPVLVNNLAGVAMVAAGNGHSLALLGDGTLRGWGYNQYGQLGDGSTTKRLTPVPVGGLAGATAVATGALHSLALLGDGTVRTWGMNDGGQLGDGSTTARHSPVQVPGIAGATAIAGGYAHSVALLGDGTARAWGRNGDRQLGDGTTTDRLSPVKVGGVAGATAVVTSNLHTLLIAPATFSLALATTGGGAVNVAPGGSAFAVGTVVTLTPLPKPGALFTGWTVDGQFVGWANPLTITMNADHSVVATFAAVPSFADVPADHPAITAIAQLAARGIVKGYGNGEFGSADTTQRAQMAAFVARAMGWDAEDWGNPFGDQGGIDPNLWRNVGALAHYKVASGYDPAHFGPTDKVTQAQTISFIARAMVARGYWQPQPDDPALYPNVPASSGHRADIATFVHYAGALPDTQPGQPLAEWGQPAARAWFARAEWQALDSYWSVDRVP